MKNPPDLKTDHINMAEALVEWMKIQAEKTEDYQHDFKAIETAINGLIAENNALNARVQALEEVTNSMWHLHGQVPLQ